VGLALRKSRVVFQVASIWLSASGIASSELHAASLTTHTPVEVQMRNLNLHLEHSIVLQIRRLRGQMIATGEAEPVTFDDAKSFVTRISSAEIGMTGASMSALLNQYVFAYDGAPLKNIVVTMKDGRIRQTGTMHKGIDVPFEIEGTLDATPEGEIRLHADKVRSGHVPLKGLMHLFGEDLSKLINIKQDRGVRLEGDNILLNPARMLPPPQIEGKVTAVRIEGDRIVQIFGSEEENLLSPPLKARNYIYHKGGVLRFGKLTMTDTDLEIVDQTQHVAFDFSLLEYNRQLVAGYSKNTPSHGLIVFMPGFGLLSSSRK
jgi:hypothetical protein